MPATQDASFEWLIAVLALRGLAYIEVTSVLTLISFLRARGSGAHARACPSGRARRRSRIGAPARPAAALPPSWFGRRFAERIMKLVDLGEELSRTQLRGQVDRVEDRFERCEPITGVPHHPA